MMTDDGNIFGSLKDEASVPRVLHMLHVQFFDSFGSVLTPESGSKLGLAVMSLSMKIWIQYHSDRICSVKRRRYHQMPCPSCYNKCDATCIPVKALPVPLDGFHGRLSIPVINFLIPELQTRCQLISRRRWLGALWCGKTDVGGVDGRALPFAKCSAVPMQWALISTNHRQFVVEVCKFSTPRHCIMAKKQVHQKSNALTG
ncbi:hypothetical protein CC1G_08431 [Coprinopsis cinerea okayama7|uniref:Uncharacterized protein n=1 Tax=Coprinopsis cinerea (strain Okayama-7 / 130 / ATCC MYA-4618 / FGSC 9003) TaxID=240176 RepID=A8NAR2_COPC7|nr:hypothetical protein CC1G_08431 [Coprinopsis cinerea okayama7\|eukprot:XP_001831914.2 hypothetical protein CC1G_08431 [Coprinopsis cinerea okayama7\